MKWVGWFSFIILLCYSSYPERVRKIERKIEKEIKLKYNKSINNVE